MLAVTLLIAGCSPIYYAPNAHNVPLFTEKGEASFSGSCEIMDQSTGGNIQTAVALSDHISIMAGGFHVKTEYTNEFDSDKQEVSKGYLVELGAGYFDAFNVSSKMNLVLETYGGMGFGKYDNSTRVPSYFDYNSAWTDYYARNASYQRYFIQPSLGLKSAYFEFALSARFAGLTYTNYTVDYDAPELPLDNWSLLLEPGITLRAGFKNVKIQSQIGLSLNLNNPDLIQEHFYFSLGLYFNIGPEDPAGNNNRIGTE